MVYTFSIVLRNAPLNEPHQEQCFRTSVDACDLFTAVCNVLTVVTGDRWFSIWLNFQPGGHVCVYDSEFGFDYRFVDMVRPA